MSHASGELFLLCNERADFMNLGGHLLGCEPSIDIEDVGISAVTIVDVVLGLGGIETASCSRFAKRHFILNFSR